LAWPVFALYVPFVAKPLVIAHRGASVEKPENTLAAFRRALALEADGIELDVRVTRDGVPVVFHDASLRRLTVSRGSVARRNWRELAGLRVRGTEPIPRLVEVLRLTRGLVVVQIELKAGPVAPVVRAIRQARATEWVILASFESRLVAAARDLAPAIPRMLISEGREAPAVFVRSAAWVRHFHARGLAVWAWTVNDAATARQLAEWGIDALLGDDPALLKNAV
jgi:glycerophosphoryl diester phosphodiesterase